MKIPFERSEKELVFIYINPKNSASQYPPDVKLFFLADHADILFTQITQIFYSRRSRRYFIHTDHADILFTQITQISQMDSHRSHRWIHAVLMAIGIADILFTQSRWQSGLQIDSYRSRRYYYSRSPDGNRDRRK